MTKSIKVILFDLGNTLSYFQGDWDQTIELAIGRMELFLKNNQILMTSAPFSRVFSEAMKNYYITRDIDYVETTTAVLLKELLLEKYEVDLSDSMVAAALDIFYTTTGEHWHQDEYAIETLESLKSKGYRLGLISNASHAPDVYQQINSQGLEPYFDIVIISAEVGIRKPHPSIFQLALNHFSCQPEEAVMVGDTLTADILGSRKAGIRNIWVRRWTSPTSTHTHDDGIIPDKTVQYLFELPPLLEWWSQ